MINSFVIRALPENNRLVIMLDGFFMESEIDLTLHLINNEIKKLSTGFSVLLDIQNFDSVDCIQKLNLKKIKEVLKTLGSNNIVLKKSENADKNKWHVNVGFYPYEIGWYLS